MGNVIYIVFYEYKHFVFEKLKFILIEGFKKYMF